MVEGMKYCIAARGGNLQRLDEINNFLWRFEGVLILILGQRMRNWNRRIFPDFNLDTFIKDSSDHQCTDQLIL